MTNLRQLAHRARQTHLLGGPTGHEQALLLLADALAPIDPITAPPDADLIAAACQYADWATDPDEKLTWARYAEHASRRLYGSDSRCYLLVAETYAGILIAQELRYPAIPLYEHVLGVWLRHRGQHEQVIYLHHLLGQALHADGRCDEADEHAMAALSLRIAVGEGPDVRIEELLTGAAAVLAGCGHTADATRLLQIHGPRLAWTGYPLERAADHLARTEGEHPKVCSRREPSRPALDPAMPGQRHEQWLAVLQATTRSCDASSPTPISAAQPPGAADAEPKRHPVLETAMTPPSMPKTPR